MDSVFTKLPTAKSSLVYNGNLQELINAGTTAHGTIYYRLTTDGTWLTSIPKGQDAGTYTVYYYIKGDANHNDSSQDNYVSVTIAKAAGSVTPPTAIDGLKYTGEAQTLINAGSTTGGTLMYKLDGAFQGETWVINEEPYIDDMFFTINFISNNSNYSSIEFSHHVKFGDSLYYDGILVCESDRFGEIYTWTDQAYRTVTFLEPPTGDLLTWLQANAVKQSEGSSIENQTITEGTYVGKTFTDCDINDGTFTDCVFISNKIGGGSFIDSELVQCSWNITKDETDFNNCEIHSCSENIQINADDVTFTNCDIHSNTAPIYLNGANPTFIGGSIHNNQTPNGTPIISGPNVSNLTITSTVLYDNSSL